MNVFITFSKRLRPVNDYDYDYVYVTFTITIIIPITFSLCLLLIMLEVALIIFLIFRHFKQSIHFHHLHYWCGNLPSAVDFCFSIHFVEKYVEIAIRIKYIILYRNRLNKQNSILIFFSYFIVHVLELDNRVVLIKN